MSDTALIWETGPLEGQLWAFHPDGTLYATVLPSLSHGVVASVGGRRSWYAIEWDAFLDIDAKFAEADR